MTACPDHPRVLGARLNDCRECDREAAAAKDQREAHAAAVRAEFHAHRHTTPRRESPTLADLSDAPTRAEGEQP